MLTDNPIMGFIPTTNAARAKAFYIETLGLRFISQDHFALVVQSGDTFIRIVPVGTFTPHPFTIFGWRVTNIAEEVHALTERGVPFQRYSFVEQDEAGIWTAPNGDRVAWFADPDGNILGLSYHVSA